MKWTADSWRGFDAQQQPDYADGEALAATTRELASYPPLVAPAEIDALRAGLAEAQAGRAFFLQGGDCAESFAEYSPETIAGSFHLLNAMAGTIASAAGVPVVSAARMAGQFAKPRSTPTETKQGVALPAYRGDIVNGIGFDARERAPDPQRMFRAYAQSYATLARFREMSSQAGAALYTCHEALLLPYEEALVRTDGNGLFYASSAHFLWIGDRTRFPGSAHVEFARGLANPLGIKCGPGLDEATLLALLDTLNPQRQAGRITLISRMGADRVENALPPLFRAVAREGHPVLWSCDPMHGNTIRANGYKTRPFARILDEVRSFFALAAAERVRGGGIHLELTGQDVTECTGGAVQVTEQALGDRYHTHCDPRLNPDQAMELAALLASILAARRDDGARAA